MVVPILVGGLLFATAPAAPQEVPRPILCAVTEVMEWSASNGCERSDPRLADVPQFVRIDAGRRLLVSADGRRTSPIEAIQRVNSRLMLRACRTSADGGS